MTREEFAARIEEIRIKLFRTAMIYLGNEQDALEAVDETVYRGLCAVKKLRQPEYFDTWMTRILINECYKMIRRHKREELTETMPEISQEVFDRLPLKDAIGMLPEELRDIVVLRFFGGFTMAETSIILKIPQGTVATRQRKALGLLRLALDEEGFEKEVKHGLQR